MVPTLLFTVDEVNHKTLKIVSDLMYVKWELYPILDWWMVMVFVVVYYLEFRLPLTSRVGGMKIAAEEEKTRVR